MVASAASDRTGPPTIKSAFLSNINFSTASRASLTGTPGSRSRVSMVSTRKGRFLPPPTSTPPEALISSTAIVTPRSASHPYKNAVDRGHPITMGFSAYAAPAVKNNAMVIRKTINRFKGLVFMARPPFHRRCDRGLMIALLWLQSIAIMAYGNEGLREG